MAKAKDTVMEVEDTDVEETEENTIVRPSELAEDLGVNPKAVRQYLRANFPRTAAEKNTSWQLNEDQIAAVISHFEADDEDDSDSEDTDES